MIICSCNLLLFQLLLEFLPLIKKKKKSDYYLQLTEAERESDFT